MDSTEKAILALVGIGGVVGGAILLTRSTSLTPFTIETTATSIPSSGGSISITGQSGYQLGTTLYIFVNGQMSGTTTVSGNGTFDFTLPFNANTTGNTITWKIDVSTDTQNL